ncbi:MAG: hypothetical protein KUG83_11125 [Gammaproteobacteria bacterium]|nr:hypothetical protein [Gammaproteobacteria bacterium]
MVLIASMAFGSPNTHLFFYTPLIKNVSDQWRHGRPLCLPIADLIKVIGNMET